MKKTDTSSSSQWLNDMQTLTRDLQNETILFTQPALGLGGILVLSLVIWTNNPVWEMIIAGGLVLLASVVWRIYRTSFLQASILLIAGTWTAVLLTAMGRIFVTTPLGRKAPQSSHAQSFIVHYSLPLFCSPSACL